MADQNPTDPPSVDDEDIARLLSAAEAVIAAEDGRIDAEEDRALLIEGAEVREQIHSVIARGGEIRAISGREHVSAGSRELLEWLFEDMQQLVDVLQGAR